MKVFIHRGASNNYPENTEVSINNVAMNMQILDITQKQELIINESICS